MGREVLQWTLRSYKEIKQKKRENDTQTRDARNNQFFKTHKNEFSSSAFDCFEKKQRHNR